MGPAPEIGRLLMELALRIQVLVGVNDAYGRQGLAYLALQSRAPGHDRASSIEVMGSPVH